MSAKQNIADEIATSLNKQRDIELIASEINKDDFVNSEKLQKLQKLKNFCKQQTDDSLTMLQQNNSSLAYLDIIHQEIVENIQNLTITIFEKFDFYPENLLEFNGLLNDSSGLLSKERKIIKEAISLKIIGSYYLFRTTQEMLEEKQILSTCLNLIKRLETDQFYVR